MKCLVTGGCGFVGRHFVKRFADLGDEVTVIDNMVSGVPPEDWLHKPDKTDKLKIHFADCRHMLTAHQPSYYDLVVHCAAIVGGRMTIEHDPLAIGTNLSVDSELFNWAVRGKRMPRVIYFSSSAVYPPSWQTRERHVALPERMLDLDALDTVELPDRTYGFTKLAGELLAKYAREEYGLDVHIYRPFGGYGEDQSLDYPFPSIIRRILKDEDPVTIWGSGKQERDFVHIDDIVDCVLATMEMPSGTTLNIGSGRGWSFFDLASLAGMVLNKDFSIANDPSRPEGVFSRVADISRVQKYWEPKVPLEEGIRRAARVIEKSLTKAKASV